MRILRRPRTKRETVQLLNEVNQSKFIGQISENDLENFIEVGTIRFFYDEENGELVGFGAWEEIDDIWVEVGPFFTHRRFRGQGNGRVIFETIFDLNQHRDLFAVTKNDIVGKMFARHGFRRVGLFGLPFSILLHQARRLTLRRLLNLIVKFRFERMYFFVRRRQSSRGQAVTSERHNDDILVPER